MTLINRQNLDNLNSCIIVNENGSQISITPNHISNLVIDFDGNISYDNLLEHSSDYDLFASSIININDATVQLSLKKGSNVKYHSPDNPRCKNTVFERLKANDISTIILSCYTQNNGYITYKIKPIHKYSNEFCLSNSCQNYKINKNGSMDISICREVV